MELLSAAFIVGFLSVFTSGQEQVCPDGQTIFSCLDDPCLNSPCGKGERCVSNYCGGCNYDCKPAKNCTVGDKEYEPGQNFVAEDGCNRCTCMESGFPVCTLIACPVCKYDGKTYKPDDRFNSTDGCNTCFCSQDGSVGCTEKACLPTCNYNGKTYKSGKSIKSSDGCNTCSCTMTGKVVCTKKYCLPTCKYNGKTYKSRKSFKSSDGCNTCSCTKTGKVVCTKKYCPPVCPQVKCVPCKHGYVYTKDGCQTCECKGERCGSKTCRTNEFCNGLNCCPNWVKTVRCQNPCYSGRCGFWRTCQRYCGCLARCRSWFWRW